MAPLSKPATRHTGSHKTSYAGDSARGLLHQSLGHCQSAQTDSLHEDGAPGGFAPHRWVKINTGQF